MNISLKNQWQIHCKKKKKQLPNGIVGFEKLPNDSLREINPFDLLNWQ